ncbi:MAG: NAD(P)-dependent oxidoreductase, partial [SAR324 cluster bacterium]|nr:NAD(P)-dependent oxidoreductase [SAR324 cluster bacterium]
RGELQNEEDLHRALVEGIISGAALDVFQQEPIAEDSPLRKLETVILTPHSAPSRESYPRAIKHAVANLFRLQNNEPLLGLALDHEARARTFQKQHPEVELMIPNE